MIELLPAKPKEAKEVLLLQQLAFQPLLDKYQDFKTNPAMEDLEKIIKKLSQKETFFYYIKKDNITLGMIRVVDFSNEQPKRVAPVFILPTYRNQGFAQKAFRLIEERHGSDNWQLSTIKEEKRNCYLYEKLGYQQTGSEIRINEKMTIIYYAK
ncbi:GNAT family N-acetyltransferase [Streptococcus porcinus]|uniref:GNAT family N-acetyltransferase n=1 Tax=Streptococcus porcinus TaxID=1340 RepID=A0A7W0ARZ1_STRPO|nr:GNAT family N-acetyltransferase [Streptococcus porcinus]MBA2795591.1 GNAT family N-acetyltransferase [Streptococcus porcinus]